MLKTIWWVILQLCRIILNNLMCFPRESSQYYREMTWLCFYTLPRSFWNMLFLLYFSLLQTFVFNSHEQGKLGDVYSFRCSHLIQVNNMIYICNLISLYYNTEQLFVCKQVSNHLIYDYTIQCNISVPEYIQWHINVTRPSRCVYWHYTSLYW